MQIHENVNTSNKKSGEPEGPLASVRGGRDLTERPWNEVIEYHCFFLIIIVGPPYFPDTVWLLKQTHFSKSDTNVALV